MRLSLRDKIAGGIDTWDSDSGVATQDRSTRTPTLEEFQRGLNKANPSNGQPPASTSPARLPQLVKKIKDWVQDKNGFMGIFQDENGKQVRVISKDKNKVFWRSDASQSTPALASVKERKRRIISALSGIKIKASKEDWIAAREKLIEKLIQEKGWTLEMVEQFLETPEGFKMTEDAAVDYAADKSEYMYTMMGV